MQGDMAHLMPQYAQQFLVRHHVHDAGIHADAAVGAGEGVHLVLFIDLEIEFLLIHAVQVGHQLAEALGIRAGFRQHLALGIQLGNILVHVVFYLCIGKG